MKNLSILLILAVSFAAWAQEDLRNELNNEISVLYPETTLKKKAHNKKMASRQDLSLEDETRSVIINNNVSAPNSDRVTEQPSTVVEASPVEVSKGAESRKLREQMERGTEDVIVQQLEKDRIDAEKERVKKAQDIFNKEQPKQEVAAPVAPVYVPPVAVQEVAPTVSVAPTQTVESVIPATQTAEDERMSYYVGGLAGFGDYSTANNVDGKFGLGAVMGLEFSSKFIIETGFIWSQYDINNVFSCYQFDYWGNCMSGSFVPMTQRMDQYNINLAGKYAFLRGRVRPVVGAILSYTYRTFKNKYNPTNFNYYSNTQQNNPPDTRALDGGVSVGADIRLSDSFHIGADLKYMMNLTYDRDDNPRTRNYNNTQPIEELSYYFFTVQGTFRF